MSEKENALTMYRRTSFSFSFWNRRKSFITPSLASLVSFSATPKACSSYKRSLVRCTSMMVPCSAYMYQAVSCLAYLISPCLLWVYICHATEGMCDGTEQLVGDEVSARRLLMRAAGGRVGTCVGAVGRALVAAWRRPIAMRGWEIGIDGCAVGFAAPSRI